ncbi:MAG: alpha/beta hydrolase [Verrucomicrobiota bacterium]
MVSLVIATVIVGVVFAGLVFLIQDSLIYHPRRYTEDYFENLKRTGGEELAFQADQGKQFVYVIPPKTGAPPEEVWLCFSGNGGTALDWAVHFYPHPEEDAFLLIDYPGYGQSEGEPSPKAIEETILGAVTAYLARTGGKMKELRPKLRVFGHSIGAASALIAARELGAEKAVLISPFGRMKDLIAPPLRPLLRHRFDNVESLERIADSGLTFKADVFHGTRDSVIPYSMAVSLSEDFPSMITLHAVEGAGHNDILDAAAGEIAAAMGE